MIAKIYKIVEKQFVFVTEHKYSVNDKFKCDNTTHNVYAHFRYTHRQHFIADVEYYVVLGPFPTLAKAADYKRKFLKNVER